MKTALSLFALVAAFAPINSIPALSQQEPIHLSCDGQLSYGLVNERTKHENRTLHTTINFQTGDVAIEGVPISFKIKSDETSKDASGDVVFSDADSRYPEETTYNDGRLNRYTGKISIEWVTGHEELIMLYNFGGACRSTKPLW